MDWGYRFWDRDSLYEEVWTTPVVEKIALPALKEPIRLVMHRPRPQPPPIEQFTTPAEREQVAKVGERRAAELLKAGNLSHPLIVRAREVLGRSKGDLLLWTDEPCVELQVSKAALGRALKFAAALITALGGKASRLELGTAFVSRPRQPCTTRRSASRSSREPIRSR